MKNLAFNFIQYLKVFLKKKLTQRRNTHEKNASLLTCSEINTTKQVGISYLGVSNGNLNFHTRFNREGGDLLNDLSWALQINDALVDSHLEPNGRRR